MNVNGQNGQAFSDATLHADCLDRWCMVAGVIETAKKQKTLYVNGEYFETFNAKSMPAIEIGLAMIGGWIKDLANPDANTGNFSGRIDEMMIFQTALTAEEIKQIYESGKP